MRISAIYLRWIIVIKLLSTVVPVTHCCSSRFFRSPEPTHISPRRQSGSTSSSQYSSRSARKNASMKHRVMSEKDSKLINSIIHMKCSKDFEQAYCQHGGRCFNYTMANFSQPACECMDGYMGERCEVKYFSAYYPLRKIQIRAASICVSAAAVSILSTFLLVYCQSRCSNYFIKAQKEDG